VSPTPTERRIIGKRRTLQTGAVLIPILEELLEKPVEIEDEEDFRFMDMLIRARAVPRAGGVFSPSALGDCTRKAYFMKKGEKRLAVNSPQTHGYFLHGNFIHLKWQFALWKADRLEKITLVSVPGEGALDFWGDGTRPAVEVRAVDGDFGGTIDAIVIVNHKRYIVDFKGINLIDFQRTVKRGVKIEYRRQIVGYGMIAQEVLGIDLAGCLLVSECKAGPTGGRGNPIALHETFVPIEDYRGDVVRRLRTLRWFDAKEELPPPECVSTIHMGFQECPFNQRCREEVRQIQRERESRAAQQSRDWKPSRPGR
jgi:hypothetical protein